MSFLIVSSTLMMLNLSLQKYKKKDCRKRKHEMITFKVNFVILNTRNMNYCLGTAAAAMDDISKSFGPIIPPAPTQPTSAPNLTCNEVISLIDGDQNTTGPVVPGATAGNNINITIPAPAAKENPDASDTEARKVEIDFMDPNVFKDMKNADAICLVLDSAGLNVKELKKTGGVHKVKAILNLKKNEIIHKISKDIIQKESMKTPINMQRIGFIIHSSKFYVAYKQYYLPRTKNALDCGQGQGQGQGTYRVYTPPATYL